MVAPAFYINVQDVNNKPFTEVVYELCEEIEPTPIYCELPDDLKFRSIDASGTLNSLMTTSVLL